MKSASLCWGQRYMWLRVHQLPPEHQHETHVVLRFQVPGGLSVAQCRAMLTHLARRHEILRTTYRLEPEPAQRVEPPGPLPVTVATTERDGTPGPADVVDELGRRPFDLGGEWPVRACLITSGGVPKQCVLVFNHLAVDAWTLDEIKRELRTQAAGLASRRPAALAPVRHQPSDLARHEASADAAIVAARSMAYWQEGVARLPRDPFARRRRPAEGAGHATLVSPALLAAGRRVAARHGVWPSLVTVAAYAAMTALYTGQRVVGCRVFAGNREAHPYPDVLTCMFSPMLVTVDASGDPPFRELVRRLADGFERAREHAYVPYDKVVEMISREGSRRGGEVRLGSEVNFIKQRTKEYGGRRTAFTWNPEPVSWARCELDTYLRIDEWRDAVSLSLHAAAAVMGREDVEWFLRGMEALVLAEDRADDSADDSAGARAGDSAGARAGDSAGARAGGGAGARAGDRAGVRAAVAAGPPPLAPPRSPGPPQPPPAEPPPDPAATDPAVTDAAVTDAAVTDAAVAALAEAVRETHGLPHVDPSDSYVLAGGLALRVPRVLALLRERGWEGLTLHQLTGPAPLGALAARLAPGPRTPSTQIPSSSE